MFGGQPRSEVTVDLSVEELVRGATRTIGLDGGTRIEVKIPPGSSDTLRVRGPHGDIYLKLQMRANPDFERQGDDLHATLKVGLLTAVLGGEAQVPTPDGPVGVKIPAGSQPGRLIRLRGHGLPTREDPQHRGNLLVRLAVTLPAELTEKQRQLFEELRRSGL